MVEPTMRLGPGGYTKIFGTKLISQSIPIAQVLRARHCKSTVKLYHVSHFKLRSLILMPMFVLGFCLALFFCGWQCGEILFAMTHEEARSHYKRILWGVYARSSRLCLF